MSAHDLSEHVHHEDEDDHNRAGERRTRWVVAITAVMMVSELIAGWWTGSVALRADGWHMGTHVGALGLTLVAYWYARTRASGVSPSDLASSSSTTTSAEAAAKRTSFFAHLATLTAYAIFPSWPVFLEALATFTIPPELLKTQKIE